jgi:hypothetical protein
VAEPECDHRTIDTVAQQLHRGSVAQDVGSDTLAAKRRTRALCGPNVLLDDVRDAIARERLTAGVREQRGVWLPAELLDPKSKYSNNVASNGSVPVLSTLPATADTRAVVHLYVLEAKARQLGHSEAGLHGQQKQSVVTAPALRLNVDAIENRGSFLLVQEGKNSPTSPLRWNRQDALRNPGMSWIFEGDIPEEGMNGSESRVATPHRVSAILLEVVEK